MTQNEKELYVKKKIVLINDLIKQKSIKFIDIYNGSGCNSSTVSKVLKGMVNCTPNYIDRIYKFCLEFKGRELKQDKTYIIVTNDEYELIVALGTLKEIAQTSKFNQDILRGAVRDNREVIYKKKYKLIEYDLNELDKENLE